MNTREIAQEYRLEHWTGVMRERVASGLSIKAYCESVGMHENVYYYWQRKLREAAGQELAKIKGTADGDTKAVVPSGWAVCEVEKPVPVPKSGTLSIEIGKCRVSADSGTDPELLARVCGVLVSLC